MKRQANDTDVSHEALRFHRVLKSSNPQIFLFNFSYLILIENELVLQHLQYFFRLSSGNERTFLIGTEFYK